ncbi:MAG: hypothetical protein E7299_04590 [Lachnospiraceae bacterium]|nr:hypothetical protein [Lachnospiraceae bacterium]
MQKNDLEKLFMDKKPEVCPECKRKLTYKGAGRYMCDTCQREVLDDFGKIKAFLDENGPTPAITIAKATGVDRDTINYYLRKGRVEIPEGSKFYLKCEKCGCSIRYGRYCPDCVKVAADKRGISLTEEMGEKPKRLR